MKNNTSFFPLGSTPPCFLVLVGGRLALGFVWTLISVCSHSKSANALKISSTCKSTPLLTSAVVDMMHSPAPFPLTLTYTLNPKLPHLVMVNLGLRMLV